MHTFFFNIVLYYHRLGVDNDLLQPFLEGWSLEKVIEAKRLFMVDLKLLEGVPCKGPEYTVGCALIYIDPLTIINCKLYIIEIKTNTFKHICSDMK